MSKLLGVVMCGGESRRMGTDKGLIKQGEQTWAQLCYANLSVLNVPAVVSVNPNQVVRYGHIFNSDNLVVDTLELSGPLNGILSVHTEYPDSDILILACDLTKMDKATLLKLVEAYQSEPGYGFYAHHNGSFFEPLCGIYTAKALNILKQDFDNGELTNYSLQQVLKKGITKKLPVLDINSFKNHNEKAV